MPFYAHSGRDPAGNLDARFFQPLADHLRGVAGGAEDRAVATTLPSLAPMAAAAGFLHDLGKYRPGFQDYLWYRLAKGDPRTHHKEAGAAHACRNPLLALAILGHHGGISDKSDLVGAVNGPSGKAVVEQVRGPAEKDCPELTNLSLALPPFERNDNLGADLFTRVLFSCLVDADWADTAAHDRRVKGLPEEPDPRPLNSADRLKRVLAYIDRRSKDVGETDVGKVRAEIRAACLAAAERPRGVFTLTVPTGGGKTLSGLAFALKHADHHKLPDGQPHFRRVIYVAPYMSIIEQNARVIREALGVGKDDPDLFEHHSLADPPGDENKSETDREAAARRAENWDAPFVVTTNVQFFESLFSNKPSRCRKLHNIARSVVLLDECQALPPELVAPTCQMLKQVAGTLGCTVVLCTATQPAFDHDKLGADRLTKPDDEIIPAHIDLFTRLKRVELAWPDGNERWSWARVADEMVKYGPALCVVNTKKAARAVYDELKVRRIPGLVHLSTAMCPAHRLVKLDEIRARLKDGKPTFLVSTQLIEAGVDISFPVVLRELGPLEGIIQAAGRCNREGELPNAGGRVLVFRSEEMKMPPGWYETGWQKVEQALWLERPPRIDDPADIRAYYERLYNSGDLDERKVIPGRVGLNFRTVAEAYQLIDDAGQPVVVTEWEPHTNTIRGFIEDARQKRTRAAFRALARFQVNVRFWEMEQLKAKGLVCQFDPDLDLWGWYGGYDPELGLMTDVPDRVLIG